MSRKIPLLCMLLFFGKDVISQNLIEQNDLVNKLHSFRFEP